MGTVSVVNRIHLGYDQGIYEIEWDIALDSNFFKIVSSGITRGESTYVFKDNLQIESYKKDDGTIVDYSDFNGVGLFWNGDSNLYYRARVRDETGPDSEWIYNMWTPNHKAEDGTVIPPKNPLNFDNINNYKLSKNTLKEL